MEYSWLAWEEYVGKLYFKPYKLELQQIKPYIYIQKL